MPKDYSNAIIYKITSKNTGRCYIGSTVQKLSMRMAGHRADHKNYKKTGKKYCSSFIILEDGNIEYKCIAKHPCDNSKQLGKAGGYYQKKYECVNINTAGRTVKEWREENKEKLLKQQKEYKLKNKEKSQQKHICLCCKGKYTTANWARHAKTKKHVKAQSIQEQLQSGSINTP
jgi:hypothetical protein